MGKRNGLQHLSGVGLVVLVGCAQGDDGAAVGGLDAGGVDAPSAVSNAAPDAGQAVDATETPDSAVEPTAGEDGGGDSSPVRLLDAEADVSPSGGGGNDTGPPGDASSAASLIGKWTFDEGTGASSADLSGQGHTATLVGGASWAAAGKEGTGLALDGTTGYADLGAGLIDTTRSFSILCWARLGVLGAWEVVASQDDVTGSLFGLKLRGDATNEFDFDVETTDLTNPGFVVAQSKTIAQVQTWVHLAGVYDASGGGTLSLYVNGALETSAPVGQSVLPSSGHFVVGRGLYNGVSGSFLNGTLDELEVHSAALTGAQVAAVYAAEN